MDQIKEDDKWSFLLNLYLPTSNSIEFNVLMLNDDLVELLTQFHSDFIARGKRKDKIYSSGEFVRFKLSDDLKRYIKSKTFKDWYNYCLEDMSLLKEEKELLASITHEEQVYLLLSEDEAQNLNTLGYNFIPA